jgi:cardiolipin synthase
MTQVIAPPAARLLHRFAPRTIAGRRTLFLLLVLLIAAVVMGLLRFTRSAPTKPLTVSGWSSQPPPTDSVTRRMLELHAGLTIVGGNDIRVLLNGDLYPLLWHDLRSARTSIALQSYYAMPGAVADTLKAILIDRARAGVRVLLLFDAFGSEKIPAGWRAELRRGGVNFAMLRTLEWSTLHNAGDRSHVRAVVIDGRIGYTGGFGFADYWLGDGQHDAQWRESNVRLEGPVVAQLQAAFAAAWVEATGELLADAAFFPPSPGTTTRPAAAVFFSRPSVGTTSAERFLMIMITGAQRRLYITNSYFVPNADFRRLLKLAASRGVDVRVITAGPLTDVKTTRLAGRYHYDELLAAGIRIYEYAPAMMHAKTLVVDGRWSSVGSMNFDNRSLAFNDELSLVVADTAVGNEMESIFVTDLTRSTEMTRSEFGRRSWVERVSELGAVLLARVL